MQIFFKFIFLGTLLITSSCLTSIEKEGYLFDDTNKQLLLRNITTKEQVLKIMGSPTIISDLEGEAFIYQSQDIKKFLFFKPLVIKREIMVINFNGNNVIKSIENYDLTKEQKLTFSKKYTRVDGKEAGIMTEIFGNIGHVGAN